MQLKTIFAMAAALAAASTATAATTPIRLVTFNIRYAATSRETNEQPWSTRKPLVVSLLSQEAANATAAGAIPLIGLQEALDGQLNDIQSGLGSAWTHFGVGRDDGKKSGEYSPILYQPAVLKPIFTETKWLSPTPDTVSFGWGAGSRRIVSIVVFEVIATGVRFIAANTHLDNVSSEARSKGVGVILDAIKAVQTTYGPLGVYLTGDFNSVPGADAYSAATSSGYLDDVYQLATAAERFGPYETYTSFSTSTTPIRIDFAWVGPKSENRWDVTRYEVLSNVVNGVYMSDHRAVMADVILKT